jgi:hypothetical protein
VGPSLGGVVGPGMNMLAALLAVALLVGCCTQGLAATNAIATSAG